MASDGLWDYFNSEEVIDMINNMSSGQRAHGQITQILHTKKQYLGSSDSLYTLHDNLNL